MLAVAANVATTGTEGQITACLSRELYVARDSFLHIHIDKRLLKQCLQMNEYVLRLVASLYAGYAHLKINQHTLYCFIVY